MKQLATRKVVTNALKGAVKIFWQLAGTNGFNAKFQLFSPYQFCTDSDWKLPHNP